MKKKLSLLLAATMIIGMMPVSAFARTENSISNVKTVKDDGEFKTELVIEEKDATPWNGKQQFELSLNNAKWEKSTRDMAASHEETFNINGVSGFYKVLDDSTLLVTIENGDTDGTDAAILRFPINAEADGKGDCTITIDPMSSRISGGTYTIATALGGATKTTVAKLTDIQEGGTEIKNIIMTESTPGSLKANKEIKVKLNGNYEFVNNTDGDLGSVEVVSGYKDVEGDVSTTRTTLKYDTGADGKDDKSTLVFEINNQSDEEALRIVLSKIKVKPTDDADYGEDIEVTVSGGNSTKETIQIGTYVDYGYTWKAEDKDVPVVYSGRQLEDDDILSVTFKETIEASWLQDRKTVITFPEGVKIKSVSIDPTDVNIKSENFTGVGANPDSEIDGNKFTMTSDFATRRGDKKAEMEFKFELNMAPDFVGDLTATIGGSGVSNQEATVTLAKVEPPVVAKTETNEVKIDYRNTPINDITLTEAYPGALKKGTTLRLQAEDMKFEDGIEYEVVSGDLKIDKIDVENGSSSTSNDGGYVDLKVKSESSKEAGVIKLSNIQLYLQRSLPAGDYSLYYLAIKDNDLDAFFRTYNKDNDDPLFDTKKVKAVDKFLTVITAGRDVDDSTFTSKVSVTIGSTEMKVGEKTIALDVPAYISADGYTMMPVRGVTEALSDKAIVSWDNATRTVTIIFGSRIISMTVGSNMMTINGTAVAMSAKVEITGERAFIPLRDLGVALGVSDTNINWNADTKTATLN